MSLLVKKYHVPLGILLVALLILLLPEVVVAKNPKLTVTVGQSITHKVSEKVKTVSIANSDVADVVVAGPKEVLLNGKGIGLTTLVIWDENNVSTVYDVVVRGPFSDQQIKLNIQLAEVNRTKATEVGFDFLFSDENSQEWTGGVFGGKLAGPQIPLSIFNNQVVENLEGIVRYISGGTEVQTMIRALMTNGVLRVLAEPNVVASSGQEARFLSGGEIPVPIASAGATGGSTITIEWKEYGVNVSFLPTIVDSGVINLFVAPEVSDLDFGNGIEVTGFRIPALRSRKAETTVELEDGETLVIGGLLIEEEEEINRRIPLLGHIPLLGYLFSDTQRIKTTNELVLVVSPEIVHALPPGSKVDLPTSRQE